MGVGGDNGVGVVVVMARRQWCGGGGDGGVGL